MKNLTKKIFLSILIVILLVAVIQRIQFAETTDTTTDYWYEEMDLLYLFYINKK